jgi:hypothetical protein
MAHDTDDLLRRLAAAGTPARPLARPWARAAIWCAASLSYAGLLSVVWPRYGAGLLMDRSFAIEQAAALATAVTAAAAAFATVVPGYSRRLLLAPLVPLIVWAGSLGRTCAHDWSASGSLPPILIHWFCLPATVIAGLVPAIAIVAMLRHGAPMTPRLTTAFAGLAVAGIANVGGRFVHPLDASFVVLAWHFAAVFALAAAASSLGDRVFSWRKLIAASRVAVMNAD